MALHLLKLAVGAESLDGLRAWVERSSATAPKVSGQRVVRITTRMAPKRAPEILAGGSLYWVIKGSLQARQQVLAFEPFDDTAGVSRLHIALKADVVAVRPRPCRPFQGWRYLKPTDAPVDWRAAALDDDMPAAMRHDLMELCLL